jgi:hypothetical protein
MAEMDYSKNFDDLLGELATPKQDFTPKQQPGTSFSETPPPGHTPIFNFPGADEAAPRTAEQMEIDRATADRSGERMAKTIDGIASFTAALIAKEKETGKYKASPGDISDLAKAWSDVSEKYHFNVSPWFTVVMLSIATYVPIFMKAANDRRFNQVNERIAELEKRQAEMEKAAEKAEGHTIT